MGALIATHHSSRRMNKTLLLVVSAIALATAVQPDVSVPADAFTEAAQLVQSMQKQGQDDNACLQLAKDFEDEVKTNVAALQEAQGNLDTGADCDSAGQSGVTAAKKVRDDAKDAVDNAQKAFNTANTAVTLCDGCDASACHGECVENCLNDKCGGWRLLKTCGLGNVALSAATSWQGINHMKCPEGWYVPHSTTYFNYMQKNGCKGNNAKSQSHGHTYYNQCGWNSYNFGGKSRYQFFFTDSLTGNKRYQHAGNYPGYAQNTGATSTNFAGWACMREGTQ